MGSPSVKAITSLSERKEYLVHLLNDVKALEHMISNDLFEKGVQKIGAEQELCLIDKKFRPSKKALEVLDQINDDHFTTELALFNLEINLDPIELKTKCFSILENELSSLLSKAHKAAKIFDDKILKFNGMQNDRLVYKNIDNADVYKYTPKSREFALNPPDYLLVIDELEIFTVNLNRLIIISIDIPEKLVFDFGEDVDFSI